MANRRTGGKGAPQDATPYSVDPAMEMIKLQRRDGSHVIMLFRRVGDFMVLVRAIG